MVFIGISQNLGVEKKYIYICIYKSTQIQTAHPYAWMQQKIHLLLKVADSGITSEKNCVQTQISTRLKQLSKLCILKAIYKVAT